MTVKSKNGSARGRGAKRCLLLFLLFAALSGAIYLAYLGALEFRERKQGDDFYAGLAKRAEGGAAAASGKTAPDDGQAARPAETAAAEGASARTPDAARLSAPERDDHAADAASALSQIDFDALRESCPDVVGWLRIDGTAIDYPIVQGADNSFYLEHLPDGTPNGHGSIMMDQANTGAFADAVTILHGHHMRGGSMFGRLADYKDQDYYLEHPIIRLYTPEGDYDVAIFAAYTVNGYTFGYPTFFAEQAEFDAFVRKAVSATPYETDVTVSYGERMLLLSTCAYSYEGARFVVLGKILERETATEQQMP